MANNNVAYGRSGVPDVFADDDPLAELARIAGYDERSPLRPVAEQPPRREPAFNLEDELLRELEDYRDTRPSVPVDPSLSHTVLSHSAETPVPRSEPSMIATAGTISARVSEPAADPFNDEEFDTLDRHDPMSQSHVVDQFGMAPRRSEVSPSRQFEPDPAPRSVADVKPVAAALVDTSDFNSDLISELETSLTPVEPRPIKATRPPARAYEPGFRMPLANFNPASVPRHEPRLAEPMAVSAVSEPTEGAIAATASPQVDSSVWEEELARVAAFAMAAPQTSRQATGGELPQVEAFRNEDRAAQARLSADLPPVSSIAPLPDFAVIDERFADQGRVGNQQKEPAFSSDLDDDFELALDEIEFDLSDLMDEMDPVAAPTRPVPPAHAIEPRTEAAKAIQNPALKPEPQVPFAAAFEPRQELRPAPSSVAAVPAFLANSRSAAAMGVAAPIQSPPAPGYATQPSASVRSAPQAVTEGASGDGDAFDPALLTDTDEMPETVPDLNVPELPVHEPEQQPVQHSEFDIDLDAELASFLTQANAGPQPVSVAAQRARNTNSSISVAVSPDAKSAARPSDGLDDFERALEEDFRRSLQTPFPARAAREEEMDDDAIYMAPRKRLTWMLPASAAGFVAILGLSGYAFYASHGSKLTGDGGPVVIAADTQPVKVAPENPGGKIVPNQDKAVYDRVATGTLDAPKQSSLISSDEQPVDVVQKTLETLPMETEGGSIEDASTPVGETEDARLLPQQVAVATSGEDQLAVMPRKVKTMVVRPDGTLVEQIKEVPAKPGQVPVTAVKTEKVPAAPALAEPTKTAATSSNQAAGAPVSAPAVTSSGTVPATTASTQPSKTQAPIPGARPVEQPVKVVAAVSDQGAIRAAASPAATAAAAAPQAAAQAGGAGGYYLQVASLPSEADAQKSYKNLSAKFGNIIAGRGVDIAKAEIAGKGTFYRVRIPAGSSKDEAAALCEKLRAAGGSCLITR
ncbi:SPOR domain-containing protein [Rhizobium lemnae]|uniref:SPOR domain-containing protein n=1 Tax=Rhizobium lemnae TaxID=1214924 RepID=A0ABV8EAU5_9HYPH|nr:SPOR domain-containing protein [Rhizobium lemnae]MCJ8508756.1 SPOR domain-containing protein [Rhizobium lemnae]